MKVARFSIKNCYCFEELSFEPGTLTALEGKNGVGKSSVIKAARLLLSGGHEPDAIRRGAEQAEISLVLDDGITIRKIITPARSTLEVVHPKFGPVRKTQTWIDGIVNSLSLDPIAFLTAKPKDRISQLLRAVPMKLTREQIEEFGITADGIDLDRHALEVLADARSELYERRKEINASAKDKRATTRQMSETLPQDAPEGNWAEIERQKRTELARLKSEASAHAMAIRQDASDASSAEEKLHSQKSAALKQELDLEIEKRRREFEADVQRLRDDTEIEAKRLLAERDASIGRIRESMSAAIEAARADYNPKAEALTAEISAAKEKADQHIKAQTTRELIDRLNVEAKKHEELSAALTAGLKHLDEFKAGLLRQLPIPGLEISGGEILVNGNNYDTQLNDAARIRVAIQVAALMAGDLGLLLCDHLEAIDPEAWETFKTEAAGLGVQVIGARVDKGDFRVSTEGKAVGE